MVMVMTAYDSRPRGVVRGNAGAATAVQRTLGRIRSQLRPRAAWAQGQEVIPGLPYTTTPGAVFIDQTTGISAYIDATGTLVPGLPPSPPTEVYVNSTGAAFTPTPVSQYTALAPAAAASLESYGLPAVGSSPVYTAATAPTTTTLGATGPAGGGYSSALPLLLLGGAVVAALAFTRR